MGSRSTERVTVKCLYCGRTIDGYFFQNDRSKVIHLGTGETLALAGTYDKRKGFLHTACVRGLKAIDELNRKEGSSNG